MTFRTRLFLTSLVTAAVTLLAATVLVSWSVRRATSDRIERSLVSQTRLAAETLSHRQAAVGAELDAEADALGRLVGDSRHARGAERGRLGDSELSGEALATRREPRRTAGDSAGAPRRARHRAALQHDRPDRHAVRGGARQQPGAAGARVRAARAAADRRRRATRRRAPQRVRRASASASSSPWSSRGRRRCS